MPGSVTPDNLSSDSLDWALAHISQFGDTDIFPIPFEYKAIKHDWNTIKPYLSSIDLGSYQTRSYIRCLIPKPLGGYRVAIQLDPIDTIIYTGMLYECAELIEKARSTKNIACSYRISIAKDGRFFESGNPWKDTYQKQSLEYAKSGEFHYVVLVDIADFYNQIYHHRLTNNLESANVTEIRAQNIEKFLFNLTGNHHSRGLPVGPSASILLAEACLIDIDEYLQGNGYIHTRYVDDFRIFCKTFQQANTVLHDISEYLYTAHRLYCQANKTKIQPIEQFAQLELQDPEQLENQSKAEKINSVLAELLNLTGYIYFQEDILPGDVHQIVLDTLSELFDFVIQEDVLPLGFSRYILRRARATQSAILQTRVLNNLDKLAPVFRDAILYLLKTARPNSSEMIGQGLSEFLNKSPLSFTPYLKLWCIDAFSTKKELINFSDAFQFAGSLNSPLENRYKALLTREYGYIPWIRANKENWNSFSSWESRAVLWAGKILGRDERENWLSHISKNSGDILFSAIAKAVIAEV